MKQVNILREVLFTKTKNILMDLIHNGGGAVWGRVHFSRIFFTFNVKKICLNIGKER